MAMDDREPTGAAADDFPDAGDVIERLGGIRPASAKLGVPVTTVQGWKNRGRIPANRHAAIVEAAARHGVDLAPAEGAARVPEEQPDRRVDPVAGDEGGNRSTIPESGVNGIETTNGTGAARSQPSTAESVSAAAGPIGSGAADRRPPPAGSPNSAILWISLAIGLTALGGVGILSVRPEIVAKVTGRAATSLRGRVDQVEASLGSDVALLKQQVERFEVAQPRLPGDIADIKVRSEALEQSVASLESKLSTALMRIEQLEEGVMSASSQLAGAIRRMDGIDEALVSTKGAIAELNSSIEAQQTAISAINRTQANIGESLSKVAAQQTQRAAPYAALLLAIGQLEAAVRSGASFRGALDRAVGLAQDLSRIGEILGRLEARSESGIPTIAALDRRLAELRPTLAAGPPPPEGRDFLGGIWGRIKATISFRRIDGESRSPITVAERALASGDFAAALAATDGFGEDVGKWRDDVRAKLESEIVLRDLQSQSIALVRGSTVEPAARPDRAGGK